MNKFEKAIEVLKEDGWTKGNLGAERRNDGTLGPKPGVAHCILGALQASYENTQEVHVLADLIEEQYPDFVSRFPTTADYDPEHLVYIWNDMDDRRQEEVEALLEKAALLDE